MPHDNNNGSVGLCLLVNKGYLRPHSIQPESHMHVCDAALKVRLEESFSSQLLTLRKVAVQQDREVCTISTEGRLRI